MLQRACDIAEAGFRRTLGYIKPDLGQWEIEAGLLHEFVRRGSRVFAYVLRVFHCANLILRPGIMPMEYQKQVIELIECYLLVLEIFTAKEAGAQGADKALVKKYFMHCISHRLGLDVCPPYASFAECMVFTIEPGIYIREEALGVRLENDFVIGKDKNIDLIGKIPIEAEEIEALTCK